MKDNNLENTQKNSHLYEIIDVPQATGVMFRTSVDEGSYIPTHWHCVEIIYLLEGKLEVAIESHTFLMGRRLYTYQCKHYASTHQPNTAILLQIPVEFMEIYIPNIQQLFFLLDENSSDLVRQTKMARFKETLTQMQIANDIRPEGFILRFNSLLFELLFQLLHNFSIQLFPSDLSQKNKDRDRLDLILNYVSKHYAQPISLEEIARIACLQTGYFCRFFKKHMGITFLEYQNELRLSHIYRDLITTDDAIHLILERHGFTNYKLFRRMFHEHFEDTPLRIRNKHKLQQN
ncbi:MAG: helix-turn-helix domain-containing protein [[Clostridium] nexile]